MNKDKREREREREKYRKNIEGRKGREDWQKKSVKKKR